MDFFKYSQDFSKLKQFYFVAKEGGLSKAADLLNLDHSSLSKAMKHLEERIKTKLFKREGRGLKLTADGERLFEHVAKLLHENDSFLRNFQDNGDELQGEIKIITTPLLGETLLTHCLLDFLENYSNIKMRIITKVENIDVSEADIAIRTFIPNQLDLQQLHLRNFVIKLWASQKYLDKFGIPQSPACLDKHRLLSFEVNKHNIYTNTNWLLHMGREDSEPRKPFYQITSQEGLHHAAKKGYGIVQLPEAYVKIKDFPLIEVLPNLKGPKIDIYFICSKKIAKQKRIIKFFEHLKECFAQM